MDRDELAGWLRLALTPGVGNDAARRLLAAFGLPQAIFEQKAAAWRQLVTPAQAEALAAEPPALPAQLQATLDFGFQNAALGFAQGKATTGLRDMYAGDDWYTDGDSTVSTTWTSFMKPSGKSGRIGRSVRRAVRVSFSVGRPSRLKKPPGILPTEYIFSS